MAVVIVPRATFYGSSSGEGGQAFANSATLSKLSTDTNGNLAFNGKAVGEKSIEVAYSSILSDENISACSIDLPEDCDSSRSITLALQGISTQQGVDWDVIEHDFPQPDVIGWRGLGLQAVAQQGDSVVITYYKQI